MNLLLLLIFGPIVLRLVFFLLKVVLLAAGNHSSGHGGAPWTPPVAGPRLGGDFDRLAKDRSDLKKAELMGMASQAGIDTTKLDL